MKPTEFYEALAEQSRRMAKYDAEIARLKADQAKRKRDLPPLLIDDYGHRHYSHAVHLQPNRGQTTTAKCRTPGCGWKGKYPSTEHARIVADEHMIRTHVVGLGFCGKKIYCPGCAAVRRKIRRLFHPDYQQPNPGASTA